MIERPELFSKQGIVFFFGAMLTIFITSVSLRYYNFTTLASQKSVVLTCKVQNQYQKIKKDDVYYILKLKSDSGLTIYTSKGLYIGKIVGDIIEVKLWMNRLTFLGYLRGFYARSKILGIQSDHSLKAKLNYLISAQHTNKNAAAIYRALYTASPLTKSLRQSLSALGISHLLAISGFHLGVLSAVLFFLLGAFYKPIHNHLFPYRHLSRDLFLVVAACLLWYVWFLDFTPSLIRSFAMLLVGYMLYDRGMKIISLQTLFVTVVLLMAFFPELVVSLGFWLSVAGVFYIFLFLHYFSSLKKLSLFILLPIFVYLMMLPWSLYFFHTFSVWHPLSILWTEVFTIFYPLSIVLHLVGLGDLFDGGLERLLALGNNSITLHLQNVFFYPYVALSLLAVHFRVIFYFVFLYSLSFFIYSIYYVT